MFFRNIVRPKNWPLLLFILANMFICFYVFGGNRFIESIGKESLNMDALQSGLSFLVIYFAVLIIMITPVGESILRIMNRCHILVRNENTKRIYDLFDSVYQTALKKSKHLSKKVKLCYRDDESINAFALGSRTLIINQGLLNLSDDEIKGILGHEFGHLASFDSVNTVALMASNIFVYLIVLVIKLMVSFIIGLIEFLLNIFIHSQDTRNEKVSFPFTKLAWNLFSLVYVLWIYIGKLLMLATSRKSEYKADTYSKDLGYAEGLANGLYKISNNVNYKSSILELVTSTHPDTNKRLQNLGYTLN